jgi:hypothetical protein
MLQDRSHMSKGFTVVVAVALAAVSCSHNVSRIRTHSLPRPNPTTYSFPLPVEEVHAGALEAFSRQHQYKEPVFKKPARTDYWESVLSTECSTNATYGRAVFADPANAHDIFLRSSYAPFAVSAVYRGRNGGLPFMADFHLHLTSSGSNTVVTVTASDAELVNGTKFGIGSCGPGQHWNHVSVKPTTVEEYHIIRYLGTYLGITNMPPVILPAE